MRMPMCRVGAIVSWSHSKKVIGLAILLSALTAGLGPTARRSAIQPPAYADLKAQAEGQYAEKSYARAHELYQQAQQAGPPAGEARWVRFRLADTLWRKAPGAASDDATLRQARRDLEALIGEIERPEDRDLIYAEVNESLGDSHLYGAPHANVAAGWPYYAAALEWWAQSSDLDVARQRYLSIVWRAIDAEGGDWQWRGCSNVVSLDVLRNVLAIAQSDEDRTRAHYEIAMKRRYYGGSDPRAIEQTTRHFEAALQSTDRSSRYVDALMAYAQWVESYGRVEVHEDGRWQYKPDFVKAAKLYRRILDEFRPDQANHAEARQRYDNLVNPAMSVLVDQAFLPGSEIAFDASWRNVERIDFTLHRVSLRERAALEGLVKRDEQEDQRGWYGGAADEWIRHVDLDNAEVARQWTKETGDTGEHEPKQEQIRLEERLEPGAYVLVARAKDRIAYELLLVTDLAVIAKRRGKDVLLYACDALTGAPVPNIKLRAWDMSTVDSNDRQRARWIGRKYDAAGDEQGIARLEVGAGESGSENHSLLIFADDGQRQTFLTSHAGYWYGSQQEVGTWRIYAHSDRPAYRPGETANFRFVARRWGKEGWYTSAGVELRYEIIDARNTTVLEAAATLSEFGSAFDSIDLKAEWPLGEYTIRFWRDTPDERVQVYQTTLFRLEEYKLPEFTVVVEPAKDEKGRPVLFRIGDVVEAHITAEYYFGGAVAAADVEVVVQQKPFAHWYRPPRRHAWYYSDDDNWNRYRWWGGQVVKRETIKTDANGKATITFESPFSSDNDFEYTIEARVIDASRREITGSGSVRVTRQGHYVYPQVAHKIHRPGEKVETTIKALDANGTPVAVGGTITVTRQWWDEVWVDPAGREVKLGDVRIMREQLGIFPPPPREGDRHPWRPIFRGYRSEKIMSEKVSTDDEGNATFTFTPQVEGYYVIDWVSPDPPLAPVTAQTVAWVTTQQSADLGYRTEGVEIIVDKEAFEVGQSAPVMISTSSSNRYVLFTVEGEELYEWRLVHVAGTIKLLSIDVREALVPNVNLAAAMVSGAEMHTHSQEIIVPPSKQFLDVTVSAEKESYLPGEEGTLTIRAVDFEGNPVSAEIAVSAFDESVLYIQSEYAGDPRQFFYDRRQSNRVATSGSLNDLDLVRLVKSKSGAYEDARYATIEEDKAVDELAEGRDAQLGFAGRADFAKSGGVMEGAAMERMRGAPASRAMYDAAEIGRPAMSPPPPGEPEAPDQPIEVRTDFRATALWLASVLTDADGTASVKVKFPQSLTRWKAAARANTSGSKFGMGDTSARTSKPVTVRLQAPRFFVVGDRVVVSYIVNNNTDEPMDVMPFAAAKGLRYAGLRLEDGRFHDRVSPGNQRRIEPHGETRYDLLYIAEKEGTAEITVEIRVERSDFTDAVRMTYPIHEHGIEKFLAVSGKVRGDQAIVSLEIPEQRREGSTSMVVRVTPSMAVTMLDALPYLIDYPYGCVEQTMSRFLPAAIVNRTLTQLGLDAGDVAGRTFGGIEMVDGQPARPRDGDAKAQDLRQLDEMIAAGLKRLDEMQGEDGGWGWWKGNQSDRYMTAYVVWGLGLAREAEIDVAGDMITPAADWLVNSLITARDQIDLQAWMLHAVVSSKATTQPANRIEAVQIAFANLWEKRERLSDAGRALLALSAHHLGKGDEAQVLVRNLENGVIRDDRPDQSILVRNRDGQPAEVLALAHWGSAGRYRHWYDGGIEATTLALRALLEIEPENALVEPATNWLIRNRRGAQWTNTRDTALAVLTLCDYLKASGELDATGEFEVMVNGRLIGKGAVTKENILSAPAVFTVPEASIRGGANDIRILRKTGDIALYFAAQAECFTLEEPIAEAGSEMFVRRDYYRLVPRKTLLGGVVYEREPLLDGESVVSGERIEVVLTIEGKNDYEYLVFEDLKPAGFEAVQVRSGEPMYVYELRRSAAEEKYEEGEVLRDDGRRAILPGSIRGDRSDLTGRSRWIHQELRDRHVAFFIDQMPEGLWQVRYEARAEAPGEFHALPLLGHAMYVPEIRANSREIRVTIEDRP